MNLKVWGEIPKVAILEEGPPHLENHWLLKPLGGNSVHLGSILGDTQTYSDLTKMTSQTPPKFRHSRHFIGFCWKTCGCEVSKMKCELDVDDSNLNKNTY